MSVVKRLARVPTLNRAAKWSIDRLPYFIRKIATDAIRNGVTRRTPFSGVYQSFDDVPNVKYPPDATRYEFARGGLSMQRDAAANLPVLRQSHMFLPMAVGMLAKSNIRILDFGGAGGIDFVQTGASTNAELDYTVIETTAMCAAGRKLWPNESPTHSERRCRTRPAIRYRL